MNLLSSLETRIQSIFENSLSSIIPFQKQDDRFTLQVIQEVTSLYHSHANQNPYAPNYFVIIAHPEITSHIEGRPGLVEELTGSIEKEGKEIGLIFQSRPIISICSDESMNLREIKVIGTYREGGLLETKGMDLAKPSGDMEKTSKKTAYLVIPNSRIIPLEQLAVNIGRKVDNDIVIDDPSVSRIHAQIRMFQDKYLIIDLNSSGGTYINGEKVKQKFLQPGDVISLAGVSMVFNVDFSDSSEDNQETQTTPVDRYENPSSGNNQR